MNECKVFNKTTLLLPPSVLVQNIPSLCRHALVLANRQPSKLTKDITEGYDLCCMKEVKIILNQRGA